MKAKRYGMRRERNLIFSLALPNKDEWQEGMWGDIYPVASWKSIEVGIFGWRFFLALYPVWRAK